jgi:G:T/U-mismatch repair DNA glycosylase
MPVIMHKFRDHQVSAQTEIFMLGTFNPDIPTGPNFFYGRQRNFFWHLLPQCWDLSSLKIEPMVSKQQFMTAYKTDFADIIHSLDIPEGMEDNVDDDFIDWHVSEWKDIIGLVNSLPNLKAIYFTRKTFNGIPNMRVQITLIANYCRERSIRFCKLETPVRFYNESKQQLWIDTIVEQTTCLRP